MDICGRHGITQNPEKFHFAKDTVEFAGFEITSTNIRPSDTFIRAIKDFPTPRNITDVRSLFGLVNEISYCQSSSEELRQFRELLSPSSPFYWDDTMDAAFAHAKSEIIKIIAEGVKILDKRRQTCLSTDWCKYGIGFSLGQKHCSCPSDEPWCCQTGWKLTFASNRYTHNAEENYAPVEGEALIVAWALDKARHFVLGCNDLIVATDHKPLLKVLGDRKMEDIKNPRLYNLNEKTLPFLFRITHVLGKRHFTANSLFRYASGDQNTNKMDLPDDAHAASHPPAYARLRWNQERCRTNNEGVSATRLLYRKTPDTRSHDNIIVHQIDYLGQRPRGNHQRSHHESVARHDPDGIPRRHQNRARTHPYLPPVQGRPLHCGGGDTIPGQNRNPAITP